MKPIIGLAVIAVASAALGTGFLNNDIELWIQQFGVGAGDVTSPIDHALIDFHIDQITNPATNAFENVIDACIVTPTQAIGVLDAAGEQNHVTCKLTGKMESPAGSGIWVPSGQIIAEGTVWADFYPAGIPIPIPMGTDPDGLPAGPAFVDVKAVGDVILVVQGEGHADSDGNVMPVPLP